jgi:hypothetical protein
VVRYGYEFWPPWPSRAPIVQTPLSKKGRQRAAWADVALHDKPARENAQSAAQRARSGDPTRPPVATCS